MSAVIGIDLGCESLRAAYFKGGVLRMIPEPSDSLTIPSVVCVTREGDILAGDEVVEKCASTPERVLRNVPRLLGRRSDRLRSGTPTSWGPYTFVEAPNRDVHVGVGEKSYSPVELCGRILHRLKYVAEEQLRDLVEEAIISVPAVPYMREIHAVKDAATIAGLKAQRHIAHSTADALAYAYYHGEAGRVAVLDWGAGTLDISVLEMEDGIYQVLARGGDTWLGGGDITDVVLRWLLEEIGQGDPGVIRDDRFGLWELADAAKAVLSTEEQTEIAVQIGSDQRFLTLTRSRLEQLMEPIIESALQRCREALSDSELEPRQIDAVLLVGGTSNTPRFVELVEQLFARKPTRLAYAASLAAMGAAMQFGILEGEVTDLVLLDVIPYTIGLGLENGSCFPLVERNSSIPTKKSRLVRVGDIEKGEIHLLEGESTLAKENQRVCSHTLPQSLRIRPLHLLEVSLEIDVNGIVELLVSDLDTEETERVFIRWRGAYRNRDSGNSTRIGVRRRRDRMGNPARANLRHASRIDVEYSEDLSSTPLQTHRRGTPES